jgi:hypothetical protein
MLRRETEGHLVHGTDRTTGLSPILAAGVTGYSRLTGVGAPWGRATRSTGEFSNGTSGENYSGINMCRSRAPSKISCEK